MIGDALFAKLAVRGLTTLGRDIAAVQSRISSGVNDPRVSADPARAMDLSGLRDIRARLDSRQTQAEQAADRLDLTDNQLDGISKDLRQLKEITLRAANDTLTPEAFSALRTEAVVLRDSLLAAANASDALGRPLFAGSAPGPAFVAQGGSIVYRGDDAQSVAQVGERLRVATGVPGSAVFDGVFDTVDSVIAALTEPMLSARAEVAANIEGVLEIGPGKPAQVTLSGPSGSAVLMLDPGAGSAAALAAINAQTADTGVSATLHEDGRRLVLTAPGEIKLSGQTGGSESRPVLWLGSEGRMTQGLRPADKTQTALVDRADRVVNHLAGMRAAVGSLGETVARAADSITSERLVVDQAVAGLEDLDVAATVTRLQTLLLSQQAAQQSFVKISGQSLFDFLR